MTAKINSRRKVATLRRLCAQQSNRCCYCAQVMRLQDKRLRPTLEHVHALTLGGTNRIENLAAACVKCNSTRGSALGVQLKRFQRFGQAVLRMQFPPLVKLALITACVYAVIGELQE